MAALELCKDNTTEKPYIAHLLNEFLAFVAGKLLINLHNHQLIGGHCIASKKSRHHTQLAARALTVLHFFLSPKLLRLSFATIFSLGRFESGHLTKPLAKLNYRLHILYSLQ